MANPRVMFIFSGKRKTGKDYVTDRLLERLGAERAALVRLSGPLKQEYAAAHGLAFEQLLSADQYKERYRKDMISWSERIRDEDPDYFVASAIRLYDAPSRPIWIISDARRPSDMRQLRRRCQCGARCVTVRTRACDVARETRGWRFTEGVDDADSECALDGVSDWDMEFDSSDSDPAKLDAFLDSLIAIADGYLKESSVNGAE